MAKPIPAPEEQLKGLSPEDQMEMSFSRRENTEDIILKCGTYSGKIPRNILEPSSDYFCDILKKYHAHKKADGTNHEIDLSEGHDEDMIKAIVLFWTEGSTDPPEGCDRQDFLNRFLAEATKFKMHALSAILRFEKAEEDKLVAARNKQINKGGVKIEPTKETKEAKEETKEEPKVETKQIKKEAKRAAKKAAKKEAKQKAASK